MSAMKRCAVIAAAAVCALFAVSSFLSDKIRSRQELEEKLECAALAELPHENRGRTLQDLLHRR
ncbi:MAG: hypothetical protein MJ118_08520, partial [Clostridia bacterium]|nr:hypothetical protein [Clostridia bacterium]